MKAPLRRRRAAAPGLVAADAYSGLRAASIGDDRGLTSDASLTRHAVTRRARAGKRKNARPCFPSPRRDCSRERPQWLLSPSGTICSDCEPVRGCRARALPPANPKTRFALVSARPEVSDEGDRTKYPREREKSLICCVIGLIRLKILCSTGIFRVVQKFTAA